MRFWREILRLALALAVLQLAATASFANDCENATSQADLDSCYGQQYTEADAALNATYAKLMKVQS